jgi:hypothetical protein
MDRIPWVGFHVLHWFRRASSRVAATLLVAMVSLVHASLPHDDDCHDPCIAAVAHDAAAHRFEAAPAAAESHPLHCLVCHWARAFRPHVQVTFTATVASAIGAAVHIDTFTLVRPACAAQPPLRSPPAAA